jgi:hypothetical protein
VNGQTPQLSWAQPGLSVQSLVLEHSTDGKTWRPASRTTNTPNVTTGCANLLNLPANACDDTRKLAGGANHQYRLRASNPAFDVAGTQTVSAVVVGEITRKVSKVTHHSARMGLPRLRLTGCLVGHAAMAA